MQDTIKTGLIGCGQLGRIHTECLKKIDGAEMVAFADVHEDAAQRALADFGGSYATNDPQRLLDDDAIDAIYICTRHDSHASLAIAAAKAGKHVMIEKPLALTAEDCQAIAEAVQASGVFLMPAFKLRYMPLVQEARRFIPNPQVLSGQIFDNRWGDQHWAQDPVTGGANVHSQGCHMTDLLRYLAGSEPVSVWAAGGAMTHPGHPCIDQCAATIQFANGHIASWVSSDVVSAPFTSKFFLQVFGDGKGVQIHDRFKQATFTDGQRTWTMSRDSEEGFLLENVEFISAIREGRQPDINAHDGLQATRIVLAADRAIRTGQVQTIDA